MRLEYLLTTMRTKNGKNENNLFQKKTIVIKTISDKLRKGKKFSLTPAEAARHFLKTCFTTTTETTVRGKRTLLNFAGERFRSL